MKYYLVEPTYKKSLVEISTFRKKDDNGKWIYLRKELGWRWGSFLFPVPETEEEIKEYLSERGDYESVQEYLADYYGDEDIIVDDTTLADYMLPKDTDTFVDITEDYEHAEMIEAWDGCWEYWTVDDYADELTDEEKEALQEEAEEAYSEEYEEGVEALGWEYIDNFYEIHCNPSIKECDEHGKVLEDEV